MLGLWEVVTDLGYRRLLFRTCDHQSPTRHWAQRPHPQTKHRVRTYLGFGEIRRPSLSLGWVAADAIWVGSRFVHSCPMFACHHRGTYSSGVTAHVCTRVCGARRERECAALGVKATVGVDRMRFEEGRQPGGGGHAPDPASLPGWGVEAPLPSPADSTHGFLGPLQSGPDEATVLCWRLAFAGTARLLWQWETF